MERPVTRKEAIAKRTQLKERLAKYEARIVTHWDEDERGRLGADTTGLRCAVLKNDIAELDRLIAELPSA